MIPLFLFPTCNCCGGAGGGGGGITVDCCPNPIPETLYVTFSGGSGASACLNGRTQAIQFHSECATGSRSGIWFSQQIDASCARLGMLWLRCELVAGNWQWLLDYNWAGPSDPCSPNGGTTFVSAQCDPFELVFSAGGFLTFTATTTPP